MVGCSTSSGGGRKSPPDHASIPHSDLFRLWSRLAAKNSKFQGILRKITKQMPGKVAQKIGFSKHQETLPVGESDLGDHIVSYSPAKLQWTAVPGRAKAAVAAAGKEAGGWVKSVTTSKLM